MMMIDKGAAMELKELTEKTLALFGVDNPRDLGQAVMDACVDHDKLQKFTNLVGGDMSQDWMQKIYQYYLADRKGQKQDYTPQSVSRFMGMLIGDSDTVIDLCAGSGALIIQKWNQNHDTSFLAIEKDMNVIPFLVFNMVLRNICCRVVCKDVLADDEPNGEWGIIKGVEYGSLITIKSAV